MIAVAFGADYTPPTTGNYFYSQLLYDKGLSYVELAVGSQRIPMKFMLNAEELTLAVFTSNCTDTEIGEVCTVPNPYSPELDTNRSSLVSNTTFEKAYVYDVTSNGIKELILSGEEIKTEFNITVPDYLREYVYTGYAFEII
jgi:hypothetical protein